MATENFISIMKFYSSFILFVLALLHLGAAAPVAATTTTNVATTTSATATATSTSTSTSSTTLSKVLALVFDIGKAWVTRFITNYENGDNLFVDLWEDYFGGSSSTTSAVTTATAHTTTATTTSAVTTATANTITPTTTTATTATSTGAAAGILGALALLY